MEILDSSGGEGRVGARWSEARVEFADPGEDGPPHMLESIADVLIANARVGKAAATNGRSSSWIFMCECGHPSCSEAVSLTLDSFEAIRDTGGAVLAPGHRLRSTLRCAMCGYGISIAGPPPRCPMCGNSDWRP